jgi:hypothetical protein
MKIKEFEDSFYWWLEELPVDEIEDVEAQKIIQDYREGTYDVTRASEMLEIFCEKSIREWIDLNKQFGKMFK